MAADPAPDTTTDTAASTPRQRQHLQPVPVEAAEPTDRIDGPAAQSPNTAPAVGSDEGVVELGADTEPDADEADEPDEDELDVDETESARDLSGWLTWAREVFSPQSGMWTTRPLAPDEVVDRARNGPQLADAGPLRAVSTAHGYASAGVKLPMRAVEWVFCEHLARAAVALVLLSALCLYPSTGEVLGYALTPLVWLHDLLT